METPVTFMFEARLSFQDAFAIFNSSEWNVLDNLAVYIFLSILKLGGIFPGNKHKNIYYVKIGNYKSKNKYLIRQIDRYCCVHIASAN